MVDTSKEVIDKDKEKGYSVVRKAFKFINRVFFFRCKPFSCRSDSNFQRES